MLNLATISKVLRFFETHGIEAVQTELHYRLQYGEREGGEW